METHITWTDDAWEHYQTCRNRTFDLTSYFGSNVGNEYAANFHTQLQSVTFAAGPVNVQKDGDGFLIVTEHIVIGLVWTPDTNEQMIRKIGPATGMTLDLADDIKPDWPRTGTWSAHS